MIIMLCTFHTSIFIVRGFVGRSIGRSIHSIRCNAVHCVHNLPICKLDLHSIDHWLRLTQHPFYFFHCYDFINLAHNDLLSTNAHSSQCLICSMAHVFSFFSFFLSSWRWSRLLHTRLSCQKQRNMEGALTSFHFAVCTRYKCMYACFMA